MATLDNSILNDVKKMIGLDAENEEFDLDIIVHINTVFAILNQIGCGPEAGFRIKDNTATWDAFFIEDADSDMVKSYVYLKVRELFDPSITTAIAKAISESINELEWRISSKYNYNNRETGMYDSSLK